MDDCLVSARLSVSLKGPLTHFTVNASLRVPSQQQRCDLVDRLGAVRLRLPACGSVMRGGYLHPVNLKSMKSTRGSAAAAAGCRSCPPVTATHPIRPNTGSPRLAAAVGCSTVVMIVVVRSSATRSRRRSCIISVCLEHHRG